MKEMLSAPVTRLGISEANAEKLSQALGVTTVNDLATNEHFLLAQNCFLLAKSTTNSADTLNDRTHPLLQLVSSITGGIVLLGALLYVAGWSYLYQYYKTFGVRVSELNLPLYDALVYSLTVIFSSFWSFFWLFLLIIIGGAILSIRWINERLLTALGIGLFIVAVLLVGYWLSHKGTALGAAHARQDMLEKGSNLPSVRLKVEPDPPVEAKGLTNLTKNRVETEGALSGTQEQIFDQAGYRLLIHANEQYYFFRPIKDGQGLPASNLDLYVVPDSRVRSVHIQRGI